uniref:Transmembrane protein n=1 Tax=Noccaea caerulescens TaxID=107243 RepID=A0A1J3HH23_NOCCA
MAYGDTRSGPSFLDSFSLSPLPFPVLVILAVASIFLMTSWYWSFEEAAESAGEQMNLALLLIPLLLIVLVRWLSSMENPDAFLGVFSSRRQIYRSPGAGDEGGSSPWGVAAVIVLLLVLLNYQSSFSEMWFG